MGILKRILKVDLPPGQSAFLWGPRKTGKTTFLKNSFPGSLLFDFLQTDVFFEFSRNPALLRQRLLAMDEEALKHPVILDEVQKVPQLLDEVHWMIENRKIRFVLCGSSARKLRRGRVNLLGGRAWRYEMFPLVSPELAEPDLLKILNRGTIPDHYMQVEYRKSLRAYITDYLKEEVLQEGLTRNLPAFSRFFEAVGFSHGELTNYSNVARDCGVDSKTVKEYYQILADTLLGRLVPPFRRRQDRHVITKAPKFYLFDVGVAGAITNRTIPEERGEAFCRAFEHFIFTELAAHSSYSDLNYEISFWRTKSGLEVDFILGPGEAAIEVKGGARIDTRDLRSLLTFTREYRPRKAFVVSNEKSPRAVGPVRIVPWRTFLADLWSGKVIG